MERVSHDDSVFLRIEDDAHHMHLASIAEFEGPAPAFHEIRSSVAGLLPLTPRYRRRIRTVPFDLQRPVWVDDAHFNIDYHVRHTALPPPGSDEQLRNLVARLMSQQLDRRKPLWELWVVEGLSEGRWVLISKVHHSLANAVTGNDILGLLLDERRLIEHVASTDREEPEPTDARLAADAARELATNPFEQYRLVREQLRRVGRVRRSTAAALRRLSALAPPEQGAGSLTGPLGPHRRWTDLHLDLADLRAIGQAFDSSVNDVVQAAVTHGFRELLRHRGEPIERRVVRAFVPLALQHVEGVTDEGVTPTFAELPVGAADSAQALRTISRRAAAVEESDHAVAGEVLTSLRGFAGPLLLSLGMRGATRAVGELTGIQTTVMTVPGPQQPLRLLGRRMVHVHPYVPLRGDMRIAVAAFAYDGGLDFGLTGDFDTAADLEVLAEGIRSGARALTDAASADASPRAGAR